MVTLNMMELPREVFYRLEGEESFRADRLPGRGQSRHRAEDAQHVLSAEAFDGKDHDLRQIHRRGGRDARAIRPGVRSGSGAG